MHLTSLTRAGLALFQGASAFRVNDRRAIILAQRVENSSAIILSPSSSSTSTLFATISTHVETISTYVATISTPTPETTTSSFSSTRPELTVTQLPTDVQSSLSKLLTETTDPSISLSIAKPTTSIPKPGPPENSSPPSDSNPPASPQQSTPVSSAPPLGGAPTTLSILVSPCTVTVTSTEGQNFVPILGSCSQTVTVVATPVAVGGDGAPGGGVIQVSLTQSPPVTTPVAVGGNSGPGGGSNPVTPTVSSPPMNTDSHVQTPSSPGSGPSSTEIKNPNGGNGVPDGPNTPGYVISSSAQASPTQQPQSINVPPTTQATQSVWVPPTPGSGSTETHPTTEPSQSIFVPPTHSSESTETYSTTHLSQPASGPGPTESKSSSFSPLYGNGKGPSSTPGSSAATSVKGPTTTLSPAPILLGYQTIGVNSKSQFVIGSQTLTPGGEITVSGQRISANSNGAIIINAATPKPTPTGPAVVVIDGTTVTANRNGGFVISGQTLYPGHGITVAGEVITLPSAASTPFAPIPTLNKVTNVVIAGETLSAGARVTVGGDILSLAPSGTGITVVGTVTVGGGMSTTVTVAKAPQKNAGERQGARTIFVVLQVFIAALAGAAY